MLINPPSVYIKDTGTAKGRGVFAARAFTDGQVVEICPVVVIWSTPYNVLPKEIQNIVFFWERQKGLPDNQAFQALAIGYGSMYNHNNPDNMRYEIDKQALVALHIYS